MVSLVSGARVAALSAMIAVVFCRSAHAADMPFVTPPAPPLNEGMVEFGTGWYLRGDFAATRAPVLNVDGANVSPDFPNGWAAGLGFGYQYNNWFRTDVTADYEDLFSRSGPLPVSVRCPIGAFGTPAGGPFTGETLVFTDCLPFVQSRATTATFLANAYLDLGNWWGFTPYVGAGAGTDVLFQKAQIHWFEGNGVPYSSVSWTDPLTGGTVSGPSMDRVVSNTSLRFAYALMGGVSYDATDHVKLDIGYRWLNLGSFSGSDIFGNPVKRQLRVQQLRAGLRYMVD